MMSNVKIYTKSSCPACVLAKEILNQKSVSFEEIVLDDKPEDLKSLIQKTGMKTVPQIFINGELIGGCSDMMALDENNKLDLMLKVQP